jgi:hypothetical protein
MVERTSTGLIPWTLVEANDKQFARVKVLETVCDRLEKLLLPGKPGRGTEEHEKHKTKEEHEKHKTKEEHKTKPAEKTEDKS